eukprot:1251525-Pyramimonas_sp.AAC.2
MPTTLADYPGRLPPLAHLLAPPLPSVSLDMNAIRTDSSTRTSPRSFTCAPNQTPLSRPLQTPLNPPKPG